MNIRLVLVFGLALSVAYAQDAPTTNGQSQGNGGWQGQRGARGGGMGMGGGRGVMGTVTEVAADHYTIKTDAGETYVVHFSANTHILKQTAERRGMGGGMGGNPPQALKPADIKIGDAIAAMGDVDATAKSIGAMYIAQIDPERAKQMREMQANYGKTWLGGKVTAINELKITIDGITDHAAHIFLVDENTTFRKHREPITMADLQVGDMVRVEGAVKNGVFVASSLNVQGMPGMPSVPRDSQAAPQPR